MLISKDQLPEAALEAGRKRGRVRAHYIRNSSPVPNWFFDFLLDDKDVPGYVHLVFLYLLRRTIGWDKKSEFISYDDISYGTGRLSRDAVTHAVALLTSCWGVFEVEPGAGRRKSKFTVGNLDMDTVLDRKMILRHFYNTDCPMLAQLRESPCTPDILEICQQRQSVEYQKLAEKSPKSTENRAA